MTHEAEGVRERVAEMREALLVTSALLEGAMSQHDAVSNRQIAANREMADRILAALAPTESEGEPVGVMISCPPLSEEMREELDGEELCDLPPCFEPVGADLDGYECGNCGADMVGDRRLIVRNVYLRSDIALPTPPPKATRKWRISDD